jgi:hypothetical protein
VPTLSDTGRSHRPLRPRQRAAVRQALAAEIGAGGAGDRHKIAARLFGPPRADVDVVAPLDAAVAVAVAAVRLGVAPATVRRYLAPSSGKLARLGSGVCPKSLDKLAGGAR